ncbi:phage tail protein [Zooshikella marina]|uniref:Phage tail protein n=1 Tax=Spartinivicinus marinus TaxID=2994442 RepID=A0A853IAX0_9GAMM|nr:MULTISPECIES: phage tail protein [Zooshikellaceae]MBU2705432.1 phage tail protein [Zooshikella ganghwensis]MCX4029638.1 phage tail protein [Spartinivicinus marinus]NYZ66981.1 phage tail protein [Spartinivicinus marinus]
MSTSLGISQENIFGALIPAEYKFSVVFMDDPLSTIFVKKVSGLSASIETEKIEGAGYAKEQLSLPVKIKYGDIKVEQALLSLLQFEKLINWSDPKVNKSMDILISAYNFTYLPIKNWLVYGAMSIDWSLSDFDAESNNLVMETITFSYADIEPIGV